jgi:zinc D-Ala-D-Ala carboxypeptidase
VWPRIREGSRNPLSLLVRVAVFLSVSVLSLLVLDHDTVRSITRPLDRSGPPTAPVLAAEGVSTAGARTHGEPRTTPKAPPPSLPAVPPAGAPEGSCDDLGVLVDRSHSLPPDYAPEDLVSLRTYGVPTLGSGELELRREAARRLRDLVSAAAADGEELIVASAYRSYADQETSHARLKGVYGLDAERMSASPGHSQHQLGTAVDFTNAAAAYQVWEPFGRTSASLWLSDHAREHGFVLTYPGGAEEEAETGYGWEPWHYRYVGAENVERLGESGLSLQAFLERRGVVPSC